MLYYVSHQVFFNILSCIEFIHISWCTTVRNKTIIIIIIITLVDAHEPVRKFVVRVCLLFSNQPTVVREVNV